MAKTVRGMNTKENLTANLGGNGYNILTTGTTTGTWLAVSPIDGVSANVTILADNSDNITALDIYSVEVGPMTSITVHSGKVKAYKI